MPVPAKTDPAKHAHSGRGVSTPRRGASTPRGKGNTPKTTPRAKTPPTAAAGAERGRDKDKFRPQKVYYCRKYLEGKCSKSAQDCEYFHCSKAEAKLLDQHNKSANDFLKKAREKSTGKPRRPKKDKKDRKSSRNSSRDRKSPRRRDTPRGTPRGSRDRGRSSSRDRPRRRSSEDRAGRRWSGSRSPRNRR